MCVGVACHLANCELAGPSISLSAVEITVCSKSVAVAAVKKAVPGELKARQRQIQKQKTPFAVAAVVAVALAAVSGAGVAAARAAGAAAVVDAAVGSLCGKL